MDKKRLSAIGITILWCILFSCAFDDRTIGVCIGILFGIAYGLFNDEENRKDKKTMKKEYVKWLDVLALASYAAAVFMIADGHFWPGIAFVGAGTSLFSAAAIYKKQE